MFCLYILCVIIALASDLRFIPDKILPDIKFGRGDLYDSKIKIQKLGVYFDFKPCHHCTNPKLKNKPVVFLENDFVLTISNINDFELEGLAYTSYYKNFEIQKCLVSD